MFPTIDVRGVSYIEKGIFCPRSINCRTKPVDQEEIFKLMKTRTATATFALLIVIVASRSPR